MRANVKQTELNCRDYAMIGHSSSFAAAGSGAATTSDRSSASLATSSMYSATSGSSRALAWKNDAAALSASPAPLSLASLSTCRVGMLFT